MRCQSKMYSHGILKSKNGLMVAKIGAAIRGHSWQKVGFTKRDCSFLYTLAKNPTVFPILGPTDGGNSPYLSWGASRLKFALSPIEHLSIFFQFFANVVPQTPTCWY